MKSKTNAEKFTIIVDPLNQALKWVLTKFPQFREGLDVLLDSANDQRGVLGPWQNADSGYIHSRVFPLATYSPWLSDDAFLAVYESINTFTLVDVYRCWELWSLAKQLGDVDGDVLEVGVWRGGTGVLIAEAFRALGSKTIYLADTFTGVVKAGEHDTNYKGGEHADTSLQIVLALVNSHNLKNVVTLPGIFPDETCRDAPSKISFLHCDVDVYRSSKDIFEWCLPRLSSGAIVVFDDFGFSGCEGVTAYCEELQLNCDFYFFHNLNGHAIFIKK